MPRDVDQTRVQRWCPENTGRLGGHFRTFDPGSSTSRPKPLDPSHPVSRRPYLARSFSSPRCFQLLIVVTLTPRLRAASA